MTSVCRKPNGESYDWTSGCHTYQSSGPLLQGTEAGQTAAIPVPAGASLPVLPPEGVRMAADAVWVRGTTVLDLSTYDPAHVGTVAPGTTPDTFAFTRNLSHRNLFRVDLPR